MQDPQNKISIDQPTPFAKMDLPSIKAEMDHRTQNMFAMINSMVRLTGRHETEVKVAMSKLSDRINALATAQSMIHLMEGAGTVSLAAVIERALEPYAKTHAIAVSADDVKLSSRQITPTSLILHELAANALVFGAFGDPDGRLDVSVRRLDNEIELEWAETCTAQPSKDGQVGFGGRLMERAADQLRGSCIRTLTDSGMHVLLRFER